MILNLPDDLLIIINDLTLIKVNKNIPYKYPFVTAMEINMIGHTCKELYHKFRPEIKKKEYIKPGNAQISCCVM